MPHHPSTYPSSIHLSIYTHIIHPILSHPIDTLFQHSKSQTRTLPNLVLATYFQLPPCSLPPSLPPSLPRRETFSLVFPSFIFFFPFFPQKSYRCLYLPYLPTYQRVTRIIYIHKVTAVRYIYVGEHTHTHIHTCICDKKEERQRP